MWYITRNFRFSNSCFCVERNSAHTVNAFIFARLIFSRFAAQKHIRGLLNSRWADAHLSFFVLLQSKHSNEWYTLQVYLTGQHKNKAGLRQTRVYYPFASTHMVNTQLQYVSRMCIQNIVNIFAGFWIRACWISAYREYFHFYSSVFRSET